MSAQGGKTEIDPYSVEQRLIVARALAAERGWPLGWCEEQDQLDFDRKAQSVLHELADPTP